MSYASAREWSALRGILPRVFSSPAMRFAGQLFSLPAQLVAHELFRPNPWGNENSPMYGKGPGSLEYAQALENADTAGRTAPIEMDYVTPTVTQKVDNFLTNTNQSPNNVVAENIAANEADKAAVNSGDMTAAEYFGTDIKPELDAWGRTKTYEAADGTMVNRSNVFTPHYETGEALGVMGRSQRRAYDLAAAKAGV